MLFLISIAGWCAANHGEDARGVSLFYRSNQLDVVHAQSGQETSAKRSLQSVCGAKLLQMKAFITRREYDTIDWGNMLTEYRG